MCPDCKHQLSAKDLVPVFSWLWLKGRCRYCHKPISAVYPAIELLTGIIFALSYIFWPVGLNTAHNQAIFITFLLCAVGLIAMAIYDIKWMLLPDRILFPTAYIAWAGTLLALILAHGSRWHELKLLLAGVAVASGVFLALYLLSSGEWIGFGDVKLGLVTGVLLATPAKALMMIFAASVLGCLVIIPALIAGKSKLTSKIPFGPYLIAATWLVVLFGDKLIHWYTGYLQL